MQKISSIKWSHKSVNHISEHHISPEEVEEACFNEEQKPFIRTGRDTLHYVFGQTESGRYLFTVVKFLRQGQVTLITSREMNEWEKDYYHRKGK